MKNSAGLRGNFRDLRRPFAGKSYTILFSLLCIAAWPASAAAQWGGLDKSFNPTDTAAYLHYPVRSIICQPDGKIIAAGGSNDYHPVFRRYLPSGSVDSSFKTGTGFDNEIDAVVLQPDGKIIAAGFFEFYNGKAVPDLVRINPMAVTTALFTLHRITWEESSPFTCSLMAACS